MRYGDLQEWERRRRIGGLGAGMRRPLNHHLEGARLVAERGRRVVVDGGEGMRAHVWERASSGGVGVGVLAEGIALAQIG
jgi:hypothetical protein